MTATKQNHQKKLIITIVLCCILALLIGAGVLYKLSKSTSFQVFGEMTDRVDTKQKVVALTFDDAPLEHTADTLKILADKKVAATFFVVGKNIEQRPAIARAIVEQGHQLGNHSYSHQRFLLKSQKFIDQEITKTSQLMRQAGYNDEITFRPPYGKRLFGLPWYLQQHNIRTIMWDVDPGSYHRDKAEAMYNYTIEHTRPGSIILLHPDCVTCQVDRQILPRIIDELHRQGYRFVTINQLLQS